MTEERSEYRDAEALRAVIIAAAIRYRDAMKQYLAGQAAAIDRGLSLDDLVLYNHEGFHAAARAEEELFALLDALEATQTPAENRGSKRVGGSEQGQYSPA